MESEKQEEVHPTETKSSPPPPSLVESLTQQVGVRFGLGIGLSIGVEP